MLIICLFLLIFSAVANAQFTIIFPPGMGTGDVVLDASQTLTNKSLDADDNIITNIGFGELVPDAISGQTADTDPSAGEFLLLLNGSGLLRKVDVGDLAVGGSGEINLGQSLGVGGVAVFTGKSGVTLQFRSINAGSGKISITSDVPNNEIDIDVVPAQIAIGSLSGAPASAVVGISDTQTLTNKIFNADGTGNVLTNVGSSEIKAEIVTGLTEEATPASGDFLLGVESGGALRKFNLGNIPGASPEVTSTSVNTLTNKTISAATNTLQNIGFGEVVADVISGQTADTDPVAGEFLLLLNGSGLLRKVDIASLDVGGSGEVNLGQSLGVGGVAVFTGKSGVTLQFRSINAASSKISVVSDVANNEIDIDVVPAQIAIGSLSGAPASAVVGISDIQTLTNKTFNADGTGNVLTNVGSSEIKAEIVTGLSEEITPASGDFLFGVESGGGLRKFNIANMPGFTPSVTPTSTNTLTNKTIDSATNTLQNIGFGEVVADVISGQTADTDPAAGEFLLMLNAGGALRKLDLGTLALSGSGEVNLGQSLGVGGVAVFTGKSGVTLQFRSVNAASSKISVVSDVANNEIDIDVVPAQIAIGSLSGAPASTVVGISDTQTLTNKTFNADGTGNLLTNVGSSEIKGEIVTGLTEKVSPVTGDFLLGVDAGGALRKFNVGNIPGAPPSVTASSTNTFTNKTIDAATNTLSNIGFGEVSPDVIGSQTADTDPVAGEFLLLLNGSGLLRKVDVGALSTGGSGEVNLGQNLGVGGVAVFAGKSGVTLQFRSINAGSGKISVTSDVANNEIDIDVVPAQIAIGSLSGAPASAVVGISDTQTLTNKTFNADGTGNVLTNVGSSEIKGEIVTGLTEKVSPVAGDFLLGVESGGELRKFNVGNIPGAPPSVTASSTNTFTNKTIDASTNTLQNIGFGEVVADVVSGQTAVSPLATGMFFLVLDGVTLKKVDYNQFINNVFGCTLGTCTELTLAENQGIDMSGVVPDSAGEGLILPQGADCAGAIELGQICYSTTGYGSLWLGNATISTRIDGRSQTPIALTLADTTPEVSPLNKYYTCTDGTTYTDFVDAAGTHEAFSEDFTIHITSLDSCTFGFSGGSLVGNRGVDWPADAGDTAICVFSTDADNWSCILSDPHTQIAFELEAPAILRPLETAIDWVRISGAVDSPAIGSLATGVLSLDLDNDQTADCSFTKTGGIAMLNCFNTHFSATPGQTGGNIYFNKSDGTPCLVLDPDFGIVTPTGACLYLDFDSFLTGRIIHSTEGQDTHALVGSQCHGYLWKVNHTTVERFTLCDAQDNGGQLSCFEDWGGNGITVDVKDTETIRLPDGTVLAAGNSVDLEPGVGNAMCLFSDSSTSWHVLPGAIGALADGGT